MTLNKSVTFGGVALGDELPKCHVPITTTLITAGAIATRDYFPGHHDKDAAQALGSPHVFMNILTTSALVQRYVEDWAGPACRFIDIQIKLGVPNYPGDEMVFSGEITAVDEDKQQIEVTLKGKNSMGNHVNGSVLLRLPLQ